MRRLNATRYYMILMSLEFVCTLLTSMNFLKGWYLASLSYVVKATA